MSSSQKACQVVYSSQKLDKLCQVPRMLVKFFLVPRKLDKLCQVSRRPVKFSRVQNLCNLKREVCSTISRFGTGIYCMISLIKWAKFRNFTLRKKRTFFFDSNFFVRKFQEKNKIIGRCARSRGIDCASL